MIKRNVLVVFISVLLIALIIGLGWWQREALLLLWSKITENDQNPYENLS